MAEFPDYVWLTGDEAADRMRRLAANEWSHLKKLEVMRNDLLPEQARLLIEQTELRRRAVAKFGTLAAKMYFTPVHLEQATELGVSRYKAARFRKRIGSEQIVDFCCGIGGDLLAFAEGGSVAGYDLSPVACLFAAHNLRVAAVEDRLNRNQVFPADVVEQTPRYEGAWHVDPDRRATGKRSTTITEFAPGPAVIDKWRANNPRGAVKLAPATVLPPEWRDQGECEWITSHRECRQLVVWFGDLVTTPGQHRATVLKSASLDDAELASSSFVGQPCIQCDADDAARAFIYDADPSILAANLLGAIAEQHDLRSLGPGSAYLTGEHAIIDPLLASFVVRETLPLRNDAIAKYMAARNIGAVEIKKRGVSVDPESLRRKLKLRGDEATTLILTRIGDRQVAIIADRLKAPDATQG